MRTFKIQGDWETYEYLTAVKENRYKLRRTHTPSTIVGYQLNRRIKLTENELS